MTSEGTVATVVPLRADEDPRLLDDPYRLLESGKGLVVAWRDTPPEGVADWRPVLAPTTALARHIETLLKITNREAPRAAAQYFTLELPLGATLDNLVPAVGGGFRGLTRSASTGSITGQARLIPVAGSAAGATIALGPVLGVIALCVGTEMLAQHDRNRRLDAIAESVARIEADRQIDMKAKLAGIGETLTTAGEAIVAGVPASGLGPSSLAVNEIRAKAIVWLKAWCAIVDRYSSMDSVGVDRIEDELGNVAIGGWSAFPENVAIAFNTFELSSRCHVFELAQAMQTSPSADFESFEAHIRGRIDENAEYQLRFQRMLWDLATVRLGAGISTKTPGNLRKIADTAALLSRLARTVNETQPARLVTRENRLVVHGERRSDGSVQLLAPREIAAASRR